MNEPEQEASGDQRGLAFATRSTYAGQRSNCGMSAITWPIFQPSNHDREDLAKGYAMDNSTKGALELRIASLENAKYGLAFTSGFAACNMITHLLRPGDHILVGEHIYGDVQRFFENIVARYQIQVSYVNTYDLVAVQRSIFSNTKMLWLESPTHPLLELMDLAALCKLAKDNHVIAVVDNSVATPFFQRPLELGADIVVHANSRYLDGNSDLIGSAIATSRSDLYEELKFLQNALEAIPPTIDCFLALRGIKTFAARMRQHAQSAQTIAEFLHNHASILSVRYPGLSSHPQYELAKQQMSGFGGILAFELENFEAVCRLLKDLRVFSRAESLGGVKSVICHPSTMTHASMPKEVRIKRGITDRWLRISIGLEKVDDLIADLKRAIPPRTASVRC